MPQKVKAWDRGVKAAQRSLKPSGLGSSPSGSITFQVIPRWPMRQGSALLMRSIVVRIHFAEPASSRDENATDGASQFRRRGPRLRSSGPAAQDGCRGSKPDDRPRSFKPQLTGISGPRCLRNSGFCVRIAGWGPHCRREGWRPQRFHKPRLLNSIPRPATNRLNWTERRSI